MKRRSTRKKLKKIVVLVIAIIIALLVGFLGILLLRDFSFSIPRFSNNIEQIINPNATYSISDIRDALAKAKIEYTTVTISSTSGSLRADLDKGTQVYFSYDKKIDWQISSLQSILLRLTIENKIPTVIDLRYNRPIVKFAK